MIRDGRAAICADTIQQTYAIMAATSGAAILRSTRAKMMHSAARRLTAQLQTVNALLSEEARRDALTGCLSRRHFLDQVRSEIKAAKTTHAPLTAAIADLDHFNLITIPR